MSSEQLFEKRYSLATVLLLVVSFLIAAAVGYLNAPQILVPQTPVLAPTGTSVPVRLFSCDSPEAAVSVFLSDHSRSVYVDCQDVKG